MTASDIATIDANALLELDTVSDGPVDLSHLSPEKRDRLKMCVGEWHGAAKRLVTELYTMSHQLAEMREILGEQFYSFCEHELGIKRRTVFRYLQVNKVLSVHFMDNGKLTIADHSITQRALLLLSPTTDSSVMDEVKTAMNDGKIVDAALLQEMLARHKAESEMRLASAQAESQAALRTMDRKLELTELELARTKRDAESQEEMLRRNRQQAALLDEENRTLRAAATEVRFEKQDVEIVPPGYKSTLDAIQDKQQQLQKLTAEEESLQRSVVVLNERHAQAQAQLDSMLASTANFRELQAAVEALMSRYPIDTLVTLANRERSVKGAYHSLGTTMTLFGAQLIKAGE